MVISDPAELLQRIPELQPLAADPAIHKAIATGDAFKVYRALFWAKWLRRLPQQQSTLDHLLTQRRLFAKPLKGTPALGSLNSVGFGFVGESERDSDGSYVALHAFVALFVLPLLPLGSYLVQKVGSGGLSSQWRIFARVPMGGALWLYTRGLALAALGLIGFGGYSAIHSSDHQEVLVVNGFDKPLKITLGGHSETVEPQQRVAIDVETGKVTGLAQLADGTEIERFEQDVHAAADHAVWNVAGVAPVFEATVVYFPQGQTPPSTDEQPEGSLHCGETYFELGRIDYAFEEPPASISMGRGEQRAERTQLGVVKPEAGMKPVDMCANYAMGQNAMGKFSGMFTALATANGWDPMMTSLAMVSLRESAPEKALVLARKLRDAQPDDVDMQRMYLGVMDTNGRSEEARAEVRARLQREPDSVMVRYLDAVLTDGLDGKRKLLALAATAKEPYVLRSATWREWVYGEHEAAARDWDALLQRSPADAYRVLDAKVGAELALGRPERALKGLEALAASDVGKNDPSIASYYALVAAQSNADPRTLFLRLDAEAFSPALLNYQIERAKQVPMKLADGIDDDMPSLARALRLSPDSALSRLKGLNRAELYALEPEHWALLYAEAARRGDNTALTLLRPASAYSSDELDRMADYASGKQVGLDGFDIDPQARAALHFVRSRVTGLTAAERARLRNEALAGDRLHSAITIAVAEWRQ